MSVESVLVDAVRINIGHLRASGFTYEYIAKRMGYRSASIIGCYSHSGKSPPIKSVDHLKLFLSNLKKEFKCELMPVSDCYGGHNEKSKRREKQISIIIADGARASINDKCPHNGPLLVANRCAWLAGFYDAHGTVPSEIE